MPQWMAFLLSWLICFFLGATQAMATTPRVALETTTQPYLGITATFGRWNGAIPWYYNPTSAPTLFTDTETVVRLLQESMAEWEGVSGIRFEYQGVDETLKDLKNDGKVVIFWGRANGAAALAGPTRSYTDSSAKTWGYDPYTDGSLEINHSYDWTHAGKYTHAMVERTLKGVLVHELGHLMGLGHSNNPASVMYADPYNNVAHPLEDDINAAQAFYGTSASPSTVARYTVPSAGVSTFKSSFLYLDSSGKEVPVSEITQDTGDSDIFWLKTEYSGPYSQTIELHLVDPWGYLTSETSVVLSCEQGSICTASHEVDAMDILKNTPGSYHLYVTADDQLLEDHTFTVTTTPQWNHAPTASVSFSATGGVAPLTLSANLEASDTEGHTVSATWHIPGEGIVVNNGFTGQETRSITFSEPGAYLVFIALNDDGPRYDGTGRRSPSGSAGEGVQTLLRMAVTVVQPSGVLLPDTVRAGESFSPTANISPNGATVQQYSWDFGDGNTAVGMTSNHTFSEPGPYLVTLIATMSDGETVKNSYPITVTEGHYQIQGTLSGLAQTDIMELVAVSTTAGVATRIALTGNGHDLPFTLKDLPPARDYYLHVTSATHVGGYWGGVAGAEASAPVHWTVAKAIDLSSGNVEGINVKVSRGRLLHVTLKGLNEGGGSWALSAWSASSGDIVTATVTTQEASITETLSGLSPASDILLFLQPQDGTAYRGGFYHSDDQAPVGFFRAKSLDLTQKDIAVSLSMEVGRSIRGTLANLAEGETAYIEAWSDSNAQGGSVTVTGNGAYTISGLSPADDYKVCLEVATQAGGCFSGLTETGLVGFPLAATLDISLNDRAGVDLTLEKGRTIQGTVTGLSTGAVAWVEAFSSDTSHWRSVQVETDGTFLLQGLPKAGDYHLTVQAEGYKQPETQKANLLEVDRAVAHFNLFEGAACQGVITGLNVGDVVTVEARSQATETYKTVTLRATDTAPLPYQLDGLGDTSDLIVALQVSHRWFFHGADSTVQRRDQANALSIVHGESIANIDFDLSSAVSYSISGTISGLGAAYADRVVTLTAWSVDAAFSSTRRAGDGVFLLPDLPAGAYLLAAKASGFVDVFYDGSGWSSSFEKAVALDVATDLPDLSVTLTPGHSLSGTARYLDSTVTHAYVSAWDPEQQMGGSALSQWDGSYRILGLADGLYQVTAQAREGRSPTEKVSIAGGDSTRDLVLTQAAGSIRGTTEAGTLLSLYKDSGDFVASAVADSGGVYLFSGLETGMTYRLDGDVDGLLGSIEMSGTATPTVEKPDVILNIWSTVSLNTSLGEIILRLDPVHAPISVANFLRYVDADYYDGLIFHRVIAGFMVQGGYVTADYHTRTTQPSIKNEAENGLKNIRGSIAMARTTEVDSATSQFFINVVDNDFLNHGVRDFGYAVFGQVIRGMDIVDAIAKVETGSNDLPLTAVTIFSVDRK